MVEQLAVVLQRQRVVALGDEVLADVAQQQRAAPAVAAEARRRADHGVVDGGRHGVEQARGPDLDRPAAEVAEAAHRPVAVGVQVLEHEALAVDHHPLERGAGLAVGAAERAPLGGARDQLVDRGGRRAGRAGWPRRCPAALASLASLPGCAPAHRHRAAWRPRRCPAALASLARQPPASLAASGSRPAVRLQWAAGRLQGAAATVGVPALGLARSEEQPP